MISVPIESFFRLINSSLFLIETFSPYPFIILILKLNPRAFPFSLHTYLSISHQYYKSSFNCHFGEEKYIFLQQKHQHYHHHFLPTPRKTVEMEMKNEMLQDIWNMCAVLCKFTFIIYKNFRWWIYERRYCCCCVLIFTS